MFRFLAVGALFLAGCSSPPLAPAAESVPSTDAVRVDVFKMNGSTTLGGRGTLLPDNDPLRFTTGLNASAIIVELVWSDTTQDLNAFLQAGVDRCPEESSLDPVDEAFCVGDDLILDYPGFGAFRDTDGELGAPDNPSHLIVEGDALLRTLQECADPCEWRTWPESSALHANIVWSIHASVFYGPVPSNYSALDDAEG